MILIGDFFHIANNTTFISGVKRNGFDIEFPCVFDLFVNGKFIQKVQAGGMVLNNNYYIDEYFDKITISVKGHLEKEIILNKVDAYLKIRR